MSEYLPGLDVAKFEAYFDNNLSLQRRGKLRADVIKGGRSNLTYRVTDGYDTWVVRRPPLGHALATAHDMSREYRVLSALQGTSVPVPSVEILCEDESIIGVPFYVMEHVDGAPLRYAADLEQIGPSRTTAVCKAMVDTLAELHTLDPAEVGLTDFGRPSGFLGRQVRRWKRQLDQSRSRPLRCADALHAELASRVPADSAPAVVHGDYRLDNLLVDADDRVTAVLDWEMATLGDPLTDVALLLVYQTLSSWPGADAISDSPRAAGYLPAEEIVERYTNATGVDPGRIDFHYALACFKLGTILEGIYYRDAQGQSVGDGMGEVGAHVEPLFEAGRAALAAPMA